EVLVVCSVYSLDNMGKTVYVLLSMTQHLRYPSTEGQYKTQIIVCNLEAYINARTCAY
ncbi:hypothetical protein ACJX0J_019413, partial [Zea mays]